MRCPKCKREIDIGKQVNLANKEFYQNIRPPIILMIDCEKCGQVAMLQIDSIEKWEDVESPILKGKVRIPKLNKNI